MAQLVSFRYLGSLVNEERRCDAKVCARIGMTKANFGTMRKVLTKKSLEQQLRMRLLRCYVWSELL